jgi:ubiquinone/menaquinone biosynthesis C-methylase UbiE
LLEHTIDPLGDLDGKVVLDIGCGTWRNLPLLVPREGANDQLIGVEYSRGMYDVAQTRIGREGWQSVELSQYNTSKLATIEAPI